MSIDRRTFIKGMAGVAGAVGVSGWSRGQAEPSTPLIPLGVPLTHSDWILKPNIDPGPAGVRHMLDACKSAGWSHIYWRTFDGGRAMYPSKIARPGDRWDPDSFWSPQSPADVELLKKFTANVPEARKTEILAKFAALDYSTFDSLGHAINYGHQIGLNIHAWVTLNEDDHGWGLASDFAKSHPEFRWVKRNGQPYRSQMSFAFPEVRQYKLSLLRELITRYPLDGLFLDWIRTGDVRDNPQTDPDGVADSGYESPNLQSFQKQFNQDPHTLPNSDPRWVATRAEPQTIFMRAAKALVAGKIPVAAMVAHPWHYRGFGDKIDGNLRGLLLDLPTWSREHLVDALVPAGYYRDNGDANQALSALRSETEGKIPLWQFGWVPTTVAQFETDADAAIKNNAAQLLLWEADYIDDRPNAAELKQAMSARSKR